MRKLVGLQWARAIAAITVVVTHAIVHPFPGAQGVPHLLGRFGVTLFFIISGYIMVITTGPGSFNPVSFFRKRLERIAPIYYVATAIAAVGALVIPWAFKDTLFSVRHLMLSLLFIPTVEPGPVGDVSPFLKLGWTLNFEMFFYAIFASLFAFDARSRAIALTLIFGITISLGQIFHFHLQPLEFYTRIDTLGFVVGVWLAILTRLDGNSLRIGTTVSALVLGLMSLGALAALYIPIRTNPWTQVWLVVTCAIFVFVLAKAPEIWTSAAPRFFTYLGDASYSIYLFHMFAVGAVYMLAKRLLSPDWVLLTILAAAFGGVMIGVLVYQFIERPITRWVKSRNDHEKFDKVAATTT